MFYRPSRMEIFTDNLVFNYRLLAQTVAPSRVIAVVKADGYGHGMLTVARALAGAGCRFFAVATVDEALYLRACGFGETLLILGATGTSEAPELIRQNLSVTVTDLRLARELNRQAERLGRPASVHLAIDSGMGRLGFLPNQAGDALREMQTLKGLRLDGLFSHFATADELCRGPMDEQFQKFRAVTELVKGFAPRPLLHMAASAAALREPRYRLDACRIGMALYGFWPSEFITPRLPLRPTFAVKSQISALRHLPKGSGVSYGLTYRTAGDEKIAVIPLGYADGLSRAFSGKLEVLIGGKRCRQVGNICMDQMMVDVTALETVDVGDEVVLLGRQGSEEITAAEFASKRSRTIIYEVPILFSSRVPRVVI